jgi:hypothetical protein
MAVTVSDISRRAAIMKVVNNFTTTAASTALGGIVGSSGLTDAIKLVTVEVAKNGGDFDIDYVISLLQGVQTAIRMIDIEEGSEFSYFINTASNDLDDFLVTNMTSSSASSTMAALNEAQSAVDAVGTDDLNLTIENVEENFMECLRVLQDGGVWDANQCRNMMDLNTPLLKAVDVLIRENKVLKSLVIQGQEVSKMQTRKLQLEDTEVQRVDLDTKSVLRRVKNIEKLLKIDQR